MNRERRINVVAMPYEAFLDEVPKHVRGVQIAFAGNREELLKRLADADVAQVGDFDPEMLSKSPKLRWIQVNKGGVDGFLFPELVASPVVVSSYKGCFAIPGAEHAVGMMLFFARGIYYDARHRLDRDFRELVECTELNGKTVRIIGLGSIGRNLPRQSGVWGCT